jgi:superfamily I DNA/RNA helicase
VLRRNLPQHQQRYGYGEGFSICTRDEQHEILDGCLDLWLAEPAGAREQEELKQRGEQGRVTTVRSLARAIERLKTGSAGSAAGDPDDRLLFISNHYGACMQRSNMLDFSDLLLLAIRLFEEVDGVAESYRSQFSAVFIDEFQDTTVLQLHLIRLLGCARITVVGDDDQSIYSFRGAQPEIFLTLRQMIAPLAVREVVLSTNYRSTNVILEACAALVGHNKQRRAKHVHTDNSSGSRGSLVHVCNCRTIECEAAYVADQIVEYQRQGVPLSSIAVLHRIRSVGPSITKQLGARGVAYQLRASRGGGGDHGESVNGSSDGVRGRLGSNSTVGRAMALLRMLANPFSETQFKLVCNAEHYRKIGLANTTSDVVLKIARAGSGNLLDALRTLLLLPLESPAYTGLPAQGTKRSLGEMVQSFETLRERVGSMRSAADGLRYALDYVREAGAPSGLSTSSSYSSGFAYDYQTNQLLKYAETFSTAARSTHSGGSSGIAGGSLFTSDITVAGLSGGAETGLPESRATGITLLREFVDHVADLEREDAPLAVAPGPSSSNSYSGSRTSNKRKQPGASSSSSSSSSSRKVTVTTVHRAKGMEWEIVFVVRMNEGVMPLRTRRRRQQSSGPTGYGHDAFDPDTGNGDDDIDEEERRIAYVAMSRARDGTFY